MFHFANVTAENAIGTKSEARNQNRIGNSLIVNIYGGFVLGA